MLNEISLLVKIHKLLMNKLSANCFLSHKDMVLMECVEFYCSDTITVVKKIIMTVITKI